MERLCDLRSRRLATTCSVCQRRGAYNMDRLRKRFGEHADIMNVYLKLTQTCRWQREPGRLISGDAGRIAPDGERLGLEETVRTSGDEVTRNREGVVGGRVQGQEALS